MVQRLITDRLLSRTRLDFGARHAVGTIARYVLLLIGFLVIVQSAGINLTTFNVLAGAIGIGFGLQNVVSNFFAGLIIMFERPIKIGDRIDVDGVEGDVIENGARSTVVLTNDNIAIIVPNSKFITENVVNWKYNDNRVRFRVPIGVAYGSDVRKVEKLLLVDDQYQLKGLITIRDIDKNLQFPRASKDSRGRLRVGAAVGVFDLDRVARLVESGVDVLVVDSAHGHSRNVIETVREIKRQLQIDVIAGNIATEDGARALADAGADAVKVGIGPGSICTTRIISGIGVPQLSAVANAARALKGSGIPIIADGGIRFSGDITKALAAGAWTVMVGGLLAGVDESPGEMILFQGRSFKRYRGMGSLGAMMKGSSERYRQGHVPTGDQSKLVPEGVEGRVPYKGALQPLIFQLTGGLRSGMGYVGVGTTLELREKARFIEISAASVRENHPHDIAITQEAPNYSVEHAPKD